ncbi:MAG TPA: signal peptidase II [Candidatus Binataceae bacterium]|nr:signal peptidase II [Candidatus Binataceae bacterium]
MASEPAVLRIEPARPPSRHRPLVFLLALVALPILIVDQWTKHLVCTRMALYEDIPVIPNFLDITYTQNPGAAFSIFTGLPAWFRLGFLVSLAIVAIIVLLVLMYHAEHISLSSVAFALIFAGALGNLIDRAFNSGRVIDFVRAHYYDLNYPIFNTADSAISIGVTLIILATLFGPGKAEP